MSHHKRGRAKNQRAGCLLCKPHKANGAKGTEAAQTMQERRADAADREVDEILTYELADTLEVEDRVSGPEELEAEK